MGAQTIRCTCTSERLVSQTLVSLAALIRTVTWISFDTTLQQHKNQLKKLRIYETYFIGECC